ncbi:DUF3326 domain-containing protein [Vampirovibrio sp.]|uniref:DUF3326 domain-containing protein n=1 Tax=Vampirovibrio sp. TaxID=2717857 RepID=UPI003593C0D3
MHPVLQKPFVVGMIVPTGVGASIGGFAGDATPFLNLLASVSDVLITHPNVANAAVFQKLPANALYVEGYGLDQFVRGQWALRPAQRQRLGVVMDAGMSDEMRILHINTINAVKSVYGVDIVGYTYTHEPIQTGCQMTESGCSSGFLKNPATLLEACQRLQTQGATAIALCMLLPELAEDEESLESAYRTGGGVDPIGGIEGILSHLVVSELGIPCANAPVFEWEKAKPVLDEILDPRTAAEFIAPTFLPCVLTGLAQAPNMRPIAQASEKDLTIADLSALVVPANALGGQPVLAALQYGIPVLAVEANQTVLSVDNSHFKALPAKRQGLIRRVHSYEEAAGLLQAMRLGLTLDKNPVPHLSGQPAIAL